MTSEPSLAPTLNAGEFAQHLARFGVDTSTWGTGDTKTIDQLLDEIRNGDSELTAGDIGLTRRVRNVWVDVYATIDGKRHHLVERHQVFRGGRVRERKLPASLGEKCKLNEDPLDAARRGIVEELGIPSPFTLTPTQPRQNPAGPPSFPTLHTVYETYWLLAELSVAGFRPEGYVEVQPDKSTYFEWET